MPPIAALGNPAYCIIVQAPALLARHGAARDQCGYLHQIAQSEQVVEDTEVGVVLVDFRLQGIDAPQHAFQPLDGAHDADVVPHE